MQTKVIMQTKVTNDSKNVLCNTPTTAQQDLPEILINEL